MKESELPVIKREKAEIAFHSVKAKAASNGYMSDEEIEAEIAAARRKDNCIELMDENEMPNAVTLKAMEDAENGVGMSGVFSSVDRIEMMAALSKEIIEETGKTQDAEKQPVQRKNITELFSDFNGEYKPVEMNWGEPTGEEVW